MGGPPPAGCQLTCQVLSPWKKKKSAKPQTTEVQTMQSRGMSLILSPLRSWGRRGGRGESRLRATPHPFPGASHHHLFQLPNSACPTRAAGVLAANGHPAGPPCAQDPVLAAPWPGGPLCGGSSHTGRRRLSGPRLLTPLH